MIKDKIIELIKDKNGKINFRGLKRKLNIEDLELQRLLLELKLDGKILQLENKYYIFPEDLLIGEISSTLSGNKVIFYNDKKYPIEKGLDNGEILNDVVAFRINENDNAEIVSIINRRSKQMTCEIVIEDGKKKIIPYFPGIVVTLENSEMKNLLDGDIILVDVNDDTQDYNSGVCHGKLNKVLAIKNSPNKGEIEAAINYGFDNNYSDKYMEELAKLPRDTSKEDLSKRIDFRKLKTFTIDGKNAKDMDDACSVIKLDNGNIRVFIHISDVSHYIKFDSEIFKRAREKTTSLYLNDTVFPMFHHIISNGICSLNQGEDRLVKTVIMDIDSDGNAVNFDIMKGIINSDKKMNYDDVDKIFIDKIIPEGYADYVEELKLLKITSNRIRKRMERGGALNFANNERDFERIDGKAISFKNLEDSPGRKLIEYLMINSNFEVAKYLLNSGIPSIYRIHEFPELKKINLAIKNINELGKRIRPLRELNSPLDIQKIQKNLELDSDYEILSSLLLRFMKRARYSIDEIGHFALALPIYTHFTAPIRRLPDLIVHMLLDFLLEDREYTKIIDIENENRKLERLCYDASFMSRQADLAEKEAERNSIIECMVNNIGEEFEAFVLETEGKIRIRLNSIDTTINYKNFGENFRYSKKEKIWYDATNNLTIKPGRKVIVLLKDVNLARKNLQLEVLNAVSTKVLKRV